MSNEEKILTMLTSIQNDVNDIRESINKSRKMKDDRIQDQLEAIEKFSRADTPEEKAEIEAFLKFMDAEEERKNRNYAV